MSEATKTTDHNTIRRWVEERGGRPTTVKGTASGGKAGLLRIDFPGQGEDDDLQPIGWEEFFKKFDKEKLALLHQDQTDDGQTSRFCKFIERE